VESRSDRVR